MSSKTPPTKVNQIRAYVRRRVEYLQDQYIAGNPSARADLARFRRVVGKPLGSTSDTWLVFSQGFPQELMGRGESPNPAENAIFHAITLFALHQQSKTDKHMHVVPEADTHGNTLQLGLGEAVRRLANPTDAEGSATILRRFSAAATAQTFEAVVHHLRGLIQLLRAQDIPLDYGLLASDLYHLQFPQAAKAVRLNWARQLYRTRTDS